MELTIKSKKHGEIKFLIDDEDYDKIKMYTWTLNYQVSVGNFYIVAAKMKKRKMYYYRLHRLIMDCPNNLSVDHINHNTLDNRKCNLRICTQSENSRNTRKQTRNKTSIYKGVYFDKKLNKFRVQIMLYYKHIHIGLFDTQDKAAIAYNMAALKYFGEFAKLNNIMAFNGVQ